MNEHNDQELNFENEFLKLKLMAETGAKISENNLPPKVENDFLKYIIEFEKAFEEKKEIRLFDKIHCPDFSLNIHQDDLPSELDKLLSHLNTHHIKVETLCDVSDEELYRFIVEDLFEEMINDIPLFEGGYTNFIYEEFYPNHSYDIHNRFEEFIQVLTKKEISLFNWVFSSSFTSVSGEKLPEDVVVKHLNDFFYLFKSISVLLFESKDLQILEDKAVQIIYIKIEASVDYKVAPIIFEGEGKITYENTFDWWSISGIDIPGLKI